MDKYQKVLLESNDKNSFYCCVSIKDGGGSPSTKFDYNTDVFTLTQDEDIFSTKYALVIKTNSNIETCTIFVNGEWQSASRKGAAFAIGLDFEKRVEKVKLTFADNIVDDYIFSIQYVEADKDLYYQKQEAERKANLLAAAQIKHSTSSDLINIYFQPCCDEYCKTEITLYKDNMMLAKYRVDEECFFKAIIGLAYGTYAYVIKQFDKKDNLLLETEYIEFSLKAPKQPIMGRINRI